MHARLQQRSRTCTAVDSVGFRLISSRAPTPPPRRRVVPLKALPDDGKTRLQVYCNTTRDSRIHLQYNDTTKVMIKQRNRLISVCARTYCGIATI